jgi:hypothetical protein
MAQISPLIDFYSLMQFNYHERNKFRLAKYARGQANDFRRSTSVNLVRLSLGMAVERR